MDETTSDKTETSKQEELIKSLKYKPIKDTILILISALIVGIIIFVALFTKPENKLSHVEIRYQNTLLWDKDDPSKNTSIQFPTSGEKKLTYTKEDGSIFLGEGKEFAFEGDSITFTLYSNKSIQVLQDEVSCHDHTCSKMGRIYYTFTPIVCLPNNIQAMIIADGFPEYDA